MTCKQKKREIKKIMVGEATVLFVGVESYKKNSVLLYFNFFFNNLDIFKNLKVPLYII